MENMRIQKFSLQCLIVIGGLVPVIAGLNGLFYDRNLPTLSHIGTDNHFHYLSGLLFAIGLAFWSCIPNIENKAERIRLLTAIVIIGGLSRFVTAFLHNEFDTAVIFALSMELAVTPLICIWQGHIARKI
jgi:hypothetical protein